MAYEHSRLAAAIGRKFNHEPGMSTSNGCLTQWPAILGTWPTDAQLAQWVAEYEAYLASAQCKDDELQVFLESIDGKVSKALAGMLIDKGICTMMELKQKYRSL